MKKLLLAAAMLASATSAHAFVYTQSAFTMTDHEFVDRWNAAVQTIKANPGVVIAYRNQECKDLQDYSSTACMTTIRLSNEYAFNYFVQVKQGSREMIVSRTIYWNDVSFIANETVPYNGGLPDAHWQNWREITASEIN